MKYTLKYRDEQMTKNIQKLPALEGTEKQISWANAIRNAYLHYIHRIDFDIFVDILFKNDDELDDEDREMIKKYFESCEKMKKDNKMMRNLRVACAVKMYDTIIPAFLTETSAKFWIEHRREILEKEVSQNAQKLGGVLVETDVYWRMHTK